MQAIKIGLKELGIKNMAYISIDMSGKSVLFSSIKLKLKKEDFELLIKEVFIQDELFISSGKNNSLTKEIEKIVDSKNFFCCRHNFKKNYSIYLFGITSTKSIDLYLQTQKALLYKITTFFIENNNVINQLTKNHFSLDISNILTKQIPKYVIYPLWQTLEITKYPIRHRLTDELILLSPQQSKIMIGFTKNYTYNDIYNEYGIKPKTAEFYLQLIKSKTGYSKKIELVCSFLDSNPWLKLKFNQL